MTRTCVHCTCIVPVSPNMSPAEDDKYTVLIKCFAFLPTQMYSISFEINLPQQETMTQVLIIRYQFVN